MRFLLSLGVCSAVAAPAVAFAQPTLPVPPAEPAPAVLAPLPTVAPTQPAPPPVTAPPPPSAEAAPAPKLEPPTTVAPVIVAKEQKANVAGQAGVLAVGVAAGAGGAAVAGPVGKFAGAFLGKSIARGIFGVGKEKTPELTVIQRDPQAEAATAAATDTAAPAPKAALVAEER